jgi:hypothetical protein
LDPTTTQYVIDDIDGVAMPTDAFDAISELMNGKTVDLSLSNCENLQTFAMSLGNRELDGLIMDFILNREEPNCSNAVSRLKSKSNHNLNINEEIDYIARHI